MAPERPIPRSVRQGWLLPLAGCWLLGCLALPMLFTPNEHGSIFIIQPAVFVAMAGAFLHFAWVVAAPARYVASLRASPLIAGTAASLALLGTALLWRESVLTVAQNAGVLFLALAVLAAITCAATTRFYIKPRTENVRATRDA
jgi:hypothetical protein